MAVERYFENKYVESQEAVKQMQRKVHADIRQLIQRLFPKFERAYFHRFTFFQAVIVQSIIWALSTAAIYLFGLISFGFGAPLVYDGILTGQELFV